MILDEVGLQGPSKIEVRYFKAPASREYRIVLVIKYTGTYGVGSRGNPDATYMLAMAKAGITAFDLDGVIHDLTDLDYKMGDELERVFIGPECGGLDYQAVVVGPNCEEAVRTLIHGERSTEPLESVGWVFRDVKSAYAHLNSIIT